MSPELRDRIARDYPAFASLIDLPDVGGVLERAATEGWDIGTLQANLYATPWWKTQSETQRNAAILYATDPQSYNRQLEQKYTDMATEARRLGYQIDDGTLRWNATRALNEGWSAQEITNTLISAWATSGSPMHPGQMAATTNQMVAFAEAYGVAIPVEMARNLAVQIAKGEQTVDGAKQYFFNTALWNAASQGNEQIKQGLEAGFTVRDILQPTLGLVAQELEIPAETLSLTEGLGQQLYNYRDPDTNTYRVMTQSEATQLARSQTEWKKTNRAESVVAEATNAISQFMGVKA